MNFTRPQSLSMITWCILVIFFALGRVDHAGSQAAFTTNITSDGTLGTTVTQSGKVFDINGGTIKGTNQFHSFGKFSVGTGDTASFNGPNSIVNILSRVTGGVQSQIDGTIKSTISGANLYLMNPAGVLFGPNASLNLSGSFHVTTADYLRLADNVPFLSKPDLGKDSLLTIAPVAAFGFISTSPAPITTQGSVLQVPARQTLSIIGGDVTARGGLFNGPSGQINLASVASDGEASIASTDGAPSLNVDSFERLGTISLVEGVSTEASGNPGGTIVLRGGRLLVDNSSIQVNTIGDVDGNSPAIDLQAKSDVFITSGGSLSSIASGRGRGGDITVKAEGIVSLAGVFESSSSSLLMPSTISTSSGGNGAAGGISVSARAVTLADRARINSATAGSGRGGNVTITASDSVTMSGGAMDAAGIFNSTGIFLTTNGNGDSGSALIAAPTLQITEGARVDSSTGGTGRGGSVTFNATDSVTLDGAFATFFGIFFSPSGIFSTASGSGAAGEVSIAAPRIAVTGGAHINSETQGKGRAGDITINATDSVLIAGGTRRFGLLQSGGIFNTTKGRGDAGHVSVTGRTVEVSDGGTITTRTGLDPQRPSDLTGCGVSGNCGHGGNINITATDRVSIIGGDPGDFGFFVGTSIDSGTGGTGDAGHVSITARTVELKDGATIITSTDKATVELDEADPVTGSIFKDVGCIVVNNCGRAGDVNITATETVAITGGFVNNITLVAPSQIISESDTNGDAGRVVISAPTIELSGGGAIRTTSRSFSAPGRAGEIILVASDKVLITGELQGPFGFILSSGLSSDTGSSSESGGTARPARVSVSASTVEISDGASISTNTGGSEPGGDVTIRANRVSISGQGKDREFTFGTGISTDSGGGTGRGGNILIEARQVEFTDRATISAASSGSGNAGVISIAAADRLVVRDSIVTAHATQADGGNITVEVGSLVHLINGDVTTSVGTGGGNGGNISIDPQFVIVDHSRIVANAFGGRGGNISISAGVFLVSPDSIIDASSSLGINGLVAIQSPVQNLSGTLSPLPSTLLKIAPLTSQCAARAQGGTFSSFTVAGRDGVPVEPGGLLPSPLQEDGLSFTGERQAIPDNPLLPIPILLAMNGEGRCAP